MNLVFCLLMSINIYQQFTISKFRENRRHAILTCRPLQFATELSRDQASKSFTAAFVHTVLVISSESFSRFDLIILLVISLYFSKITYANRLEAVVFDPTVEVSFQSTTEFTSAKLTFTTFQHS